MPGPATAITVLLDYFSPVVVAVLLGKVESERQTATARLRTQVRVLENRGGGKSKTRKEGGKPPFRSHDPHGFNSGQLSACGKPPACVESAVSARHGAAPAEPRVTQRMAYPELQQPAECLRKAGTKRRSRPGRKTSSAAKIFCYQLPATGWVHSPLPASGPPRVIETPPFTVCTCTVGPPWPMSVER